MFHRLSHILLLLSGTLWSRPTSDLDLPWLLIWLAGCTTADNLVIFPGVSSAWLFAYYYHWGAQDWHIGLPIVFGPIPCWKYECEVDQHFIPILFSVYWKIWSMKVSSLVVEISAVQSEHLLLFFKMSCEKSRTHGLILRYGKSCECYPADRDQCASIDHSLKISCYLMSKFYFIHSIT